MSGTTQQARVRRTGGGRAKGQRKSAPKKVISYKPSTTCRAFHASNMFVRGIMGPYGSGKSVSCCMEIFTRAREQHPGTDGIRRSRWAVVRNSYGELRTTTQKTWVDWFPESYFGPIRRGSGPDTHTIRMDDMELEILFLALDREDDARKLLSLELTGVWINEAREVHWNIVEASMARVGRFPPKRDNPHPVKWKDKWPTYYGIIMDTNPPNVRHWWYQQFEVHQPKTWQLWKQPSGVSELAENRDNLPDNYYENMMETMDELSVKCHVHGEYAFMRSGQPVFPQFKHSVHVAKENINTLPREPVVVGIDVGRSPGAVFGQLTYAGGVHILSEVTGTDIPATHLAELIKRHVQRRYAGHTLSYFADPAFTQKSQTRDESVSDILFNAGLLVYPASTNSLDVRLEAVRTQLQQLGPTGDPLLLVDPDCEVLIESLVGGYHYKEEATGGGRYKEVPEKNQFSHIADALQYLLLGLGINPTLDTQHYTPPKVRGISARHSQRPPLSPGAQTILRNPYYG